MISAGLWSNRQKRNEGNTVCHHPVMAACGLSIFWFILSICFLRICHWTHCAHNVSFFNTFWWQHNETVLWIKGGSSFSSPPFMFLSWRIECRLFDSDPSDVIEKSLLKCNISNVISNQDLVCLFFSDGSFFYDVSICSLVFSFNLSWVFLRGEEGSDGRGNYR